MAVRNPEIIDCRMALPGVVSIDSGSREKQAPRVDRALPSERICEIAKLRLFFAQSATIELAPEVRTSFHKHVTTSNIAPVTVGTELVVGSVVPPEITFHTVPPTIIEVAPELDAHEYFVVDGHIYVVDPGTRTLVIVID